MTKAFASLFFTNGNKENLFLKEQKLFSILKLEPNIF